MEAANTCLHNEAVAALRAQFPQRALQLKVWNDLYGIKSNETTCRDFALKHTSLIFEQEIPATIWRAIVAARALLCVGLDTASGKIALARIDAGSAQIGHYIGSNVSCLPHRRQ